MSPLWFGSLDLFSKEEIRWVISDLAGEYVRLREAALVGRVFRRYCSLLTVVAGELEPWSMVSLST